MEELVQAGQLRKDDPKLEEPRNLNQEAKGTSRLRGVINMIVGIFVGGSMSSARKRYLGTINNVHLEVDMVRRKLHPITFTNKDFMGTDPIQNNVVSTLSNY
ncbi:hypothetical protein CR513_00049, partial [Mucuna pruriens]